MSTVDEFKKLHQQDSPLEIGNVWDTQSAILFEKMGYKAIGTSSAAIADSLGYEDGEEMSFDELLNIVSAIQSKISIPLTVDIEGGYSRNIDDIIHNIHQLIELGIAGINLEDSIVNAKRERNIVNATEFSNTIKSIKNSLSQAKNNIFINIRTDFFLMGLPNPVEETIKRAQDYQTSGPDGLFVPGLTNKNDIERIVKNSSIPVNVMAMPNLPPFSTLKTLGVKRISSGPYLYQKSKQNLNQNIELIKREQSFNALFE